MGTRENQGLQIALILFVTMTVILAVTTYAYWKHGEEMAAEKAGEKAAREKGEEALRAAITELREVKQILGHLPDAQAKEVKERQALDMSLFATSYQGPRSYLALPAFLLDEIAKRNRLIADLEALNERLAGDLRQKGVEGQAQLAVAQVERDNRAKELAAVRATFNTDRERIQNDQVKIAGLLETQGKQQAAVAESHKKEVTSLAHKITSLHRIVGGLKTVIETLRPKGDLETADGKITFVDQRARTVAIDLGSADGVRKQMTFTVVDRDASKVGAAPKKGTIEIVQIDGEHSSVARIQSDNFRDPILTGDQIFTAAWQPGQKLRFALAGMMDLDGDGHSDRGMIRTLIERQGGVIDAEADDFGEMRGSLQFETRYLVVGLRPNERTSEPALKSYVALITEAERIGVEKLPLDKFLQMVGYRPSASTVRAPAEGLPVRQPPR